MVSAYQQEQNPLLMTEQEYLVFEEKSETKHEFVNGKVYAMTGASWTHNVICLNTGASLNSQLKNKGCTAVVGDVRLKVESKVSHRYPDIMVVCGDPNFVDDRTDTISNPTLIMEVLSPSTALIDLNDKLHEYLKLASLKEYVIIAQHEARIERYLLHESGEWLYKQVAGLDNQLELPSINCVLSLADVYRKVEFKGENER